MTGPETDLARIDAALAEGRVTAEDLRERELQALALNLRAESSQPSPAFAARLDQRVAAGFPKPKPAWRSRLQRPTFWIPALATACVVIAMTAVALTSTGNDDATDSSVASKATTAEPDVNIPRGITPPTASAGAPTSAEGRHVERSVELTIATAHDKLQDAADSVGTIAEAHRGFVLTSHVNTGDNDAGGTFTLKVPQDELQSTIADISKLGHLKARSENGQDVTAPYNATETKLGNTLLERRTLKLKLKHAKGAEADRIRAHIASLNAAIDSLNGQMKDLKQRTSYSTVNVTLEEQRQGSGAGGAGAAWDDAQNILEGMLAFTVRALAVLLPLALLAALGAVGARILRRRRREAPLL